MFVIDIQQTKYSSKETNTILKLNVVIKCYPNKFK